MKYMQSYNKRRRRRSLLRKAFDIYGAVSWEEQKKIKWYHIVLIVIMCIVLSIVFI